MAHLPYRNHFDRTDMPGTETTPELPENDLNPCPFCCGRAYHSLCKEYRHAYACHACGIFGPVGNTREEAAEKWNNRPRESALLRESGY